MTTPNFTPDVPQWCVAAFAELRDRGYFNYSHHSESITGKEIISIIAKHAPRPEQPCRENLWQSAAEIAALMYESGVIESDAATPKWPRYFEDRQNRRIESRVMFTSESDHGRWADGFGELKSSFRDYAKHNGFIETDAEGNALTQQVCDTCKGEYDTDGWCKCDHAKIAALPQQQASGVERWDIRSVITLGDEPPYVVEKCRRGQFVKAADHDRIVAQEQHQRDVYQAECGRLTKLLAERDAEIAELRIDRQYNFDQMKASESRAEAAEAKCAAAYRERDDILAQKGEAQGDRSREVKNLTAQLAAANERVAALEKERDGLRKALSYLHERLTEYKNGEAMIYADARGDIAVIEKALAQPSAEVGE